MTLSEHARLERSSARELRRARIAGALPERLGMLEATMRLHQTGMVAESIKEEVRRERAAAAGSVGSVRFGWSDAEGGCACL